MFGVEPPEIFLPAAETQEVLFPRVDARRFRGMPRFTVSVLGGAILSCLLLGRVFFLQIYEHDVYAARAEDNRLTLVTLPPDRGVLTDRYGVVLARNAPTWTASVSALGLRAQGRETWIPEAARVLEIPEAELQAAVLAFDPLKQATLTLRDDVPYEIALRLMSTPIGPVEITPTSLREYPYGESLTLSHVLGYVGRSDGIGKTGIEASHEEVLRGTPGTERYEIDALGRRQRLLDTLPAVDGQDLTLTIDAAFQAEIERILSEELKNNPVPRASVVALHPDTGEVFALVSYPGFPANAFSGGMDPAAYAALQEDPNDPLFSRAVSGSYPSGSVIKPLYVAAAFTDGDIDESTTVMSTGGVWLGSRFFPDWKAGGHGLTDYRVAIAQSVNTFFYLLGGGDAQRAGMGWERLMDWAGRFGLGKDPGIDLPAAADGFLPNPDWKEETVGEPWYIGDTYNISIGQGDLLVSPLQMARATAVFGSGGLLPTPHLVVGEDTPRERVVSEEIAAKVLDAMRSTVTVGTASSLQAVPLPVAGKTGTAQWSSTYAPHSWMTAIMPVDDPQIVLVAMVEQGGERGVAVAVARRALTWYANNRILGQEDQL